jgi:bacterioferritin-associated ferredoxin
MTRTAIPASQARSIDQLDGEGAYAELPEITTTGPVCGSCSQHARRVEDDRRIQVRHATVEHVRYCFGVNYDAEAEMRAEAYAERRTEMFFEGAFRMPTAEDEEEDARERYYLSLQGR